MWPAAQLAWSGQIKQVGKQLLAARSIMPAAASSASGGALPPNMQTLPFLQKDVVNLMERKAVLRPHAPLSARANRPRSAEHSAEEVASARPKTSDDTERRAGLLPRMPHVPRSPVDRGGDAH